MAVGQILDLKPELMNAGESSLGLLDLAFELLHSSLVFGDVDLGLLAENLGEVLDDTLVEVLSAEMVVARSSDDLEHSLIDLENRHVERTSSQIEHENVLLTFLIQTIRDSRGGGLIQDPDDIETSDGPSVSGRLSLAISKVRWDGDHSVLNLLAEISLRLFL